MKKIIYGMTLIECLLAILLTMLVLSGMMTLYLAVQQSHALQQGLTDLQEDARMAAELLRENIHAAGHLGCARLTPDFPLRSYAGLTLTPENKLSVYKSADVKPGTDAITVRRAGMVVGSLAKAMNNDSTLYLKSANEFLPGDILILSNCKNAEIFAVKSVTLQENGIQKIITTSPLHQLYGLFAEVSYFEVNTYFVDQNNTLYLQKLDGNKDELIFNVSEMKIEYVLCKNGVLSQHQEIAIQDREKIVGVSLQLVLSQPVLTATKKWIIDVALREYTLCD